MSKFFTTLLFASQSICALPPPIIQSGQEIKAILNSQETYKLLGEADPILQIAQTENGYLVVTAHKELLIDICYVHSNKIEAKDFKLVFHTPVETE